VDDGEKDRQTRNQAPESGALRAYKVQVSAPLTLENAELTGPKIFENFALGNPQGLTDTCRIANGAGDEQFRWFFAFPTIFSI
jgi:hypothetical protein